MGELCDMWIISFCCFLERGSGYVTQADLPLLSSALQVAGTTGAGHHTWLSFFCIYKIFLIWGLSVSSYLESSSVSPPGMLYKWCSVFLRVAYLEAHYILLPFTGDVNFDHLFKVVSGTLYSYNFSSCN